MAKSALCVGINDYPGTENDLAGCVNDAEAWSVYLKDQGYAASILRNKEATRAAIVDALTKLVSSASEGDTVAFTFSGHGSWQPDDDGDEADGRDEMLCPHDIMSGGRLVDDDLAEIFGTKKRGVRILFISDSCHSGTVARMAPPLSGARQTRVRFLHPEVFARDASERSAIRRLSRFQAGGGRQKYPALLFAGCRDLEYSYDAWIDDKPHGAFSYYALEALRRTPPPKSPKELLKIVRKSLPSANYPQTPGLYGSRTQKSGPLF